MLTTPQKRIVPAGSLDGDNLKCPACGSNNLVLEGFAQKPYVVEMISGTVIKDHLSEEPWRHDVRVIHCQRCKEVTEIISQQLWDSMQMNIAGSKPC